MIGELFESLAEHMSTARDDHPATIERLTSELVGLIRSIAADEPIMGAPIPVRPSDLMGEIPPADADALLTSAVFTLLESQRIAPEAPYVDCIRALLPFCDPLARTDLNDRLVHLENKVAAPAWAGSIWKARAVGGWLDGDTLGDDCNVGVELSWPGDWPDLVLFGAVSILDGPYAREFVMTTLAEYQEVFENFSWTDEFDIPPASDDADSLRPIDAAEAIGRLKQAMENTDALDDPDIADDYAYYAPLALETLENLQSETPMEPSPVGDEQRHKAIERFLGCDEVIAWVASDDDPRLPDEISRLAGLFIDFSLNHAGGDAYRWSPKVVEGFLHHYGDQVDSSPDTDDLLSPALMEWIDHSHRIKGWAASTTTQAHDALDEHLWCAIDPDKGGGEEYASAFFQSMAKVAREMGIDPSKGDSLEELIDTWNANEAWPDEDDDGEVAMPWARIPAAAVERCEAVLAVAEPVLRRCFAPEHLTSAHRMITDLAVDHTEKFMRGRPDLWAAAVTYAVAQIHHAFTQEGRIFGVPAKLSPQQLDDAFPSVPKSSMTSKAARVRELLDADGNRRYIYDLAGDALAAFAELNDWS